MAKSTLSIQGNICFERVRLARALQKPQITQEELAIRIQLLGMDMTPLMISRIEKNQRHVCDAELVMLAKALGVTMDWLCENIDGEIPKIDTLNDAAKAVVKYSGVEKSKAGVR